MQMKSKTRRIEPVKTLIVVPQKEQKPDAFQDMALIQGIEKIQEEYSVSIGVQLDVKKIGEILPRGPRKAQRHHRSSRHPDYAKINPYWRDDRSNHLYHCLSPLPA